MADYYKEFFNTEVGHAIKQDGPDKRKSYDAKKADQVICLCLECQRCYEYINRHTNMKPRTEYYLNFPTLGKPRKTCPECRRKNDNTRRTHQG